MDQKCDAITKCPEGYECGKFPELGLQCYPEQDKGQCNFVSCPIGQSCMILETYPGQAVCN